MDKVTTKSRIFPFWKVGWLLKCMRIHYELLQVIARNPDLSDEQFDILFERSEVKLKEISARHNVNWYKFD